MKITDLEKSQDTRQPNYAQDLATTTCAAKARLSLSALMVDFTRTLNCCRGHILLTNAQLLAKYELSPVVHRTCNLSHLSQLLDTLSAEVGP